MIGFLHTAEVHRGTFSDLLEDVAQGAASTHVVDETLLADARARGGVDDELRVRLVDRLLEASRGADVVVCTCSTLSGVAESLAEVVGVPVLRIDRPIAERAVAIGSHIAVVAALSSTIGPTTELLRQVGAQRGVALELTEVLCTDAWPMFERGDLDGYHDSIAETVDSIGPSVDVVVLAQASMASAASRCRTEVPVLSSPRLAVEAAALRVAASRGERHRDG